jgi:hypothetical protein
MEVKEIRVRAARSLLHINSLTAEWCEMLGEHLFSLLMRARGAQRAEIGIPFCDLVAGSAAVVVY